GRNPKLNPKTHCVMVRFDDVEWNRFLTMYEESQVYAKAVFLKAHFFGQKFKVMKVDKTMLDYCTKLSDFHAQFQAIGTNYNQVVKELRIHFSENKAMMLLYKLEKCTIDLVKVSREIVELSREMHAKWEQRRDDSIV
ncbi:conjugal transfer protein MobA, partial [Alistipes finegoldii]